MKFNIGDKVFIDGVVPARVLGRWMNYIVVDLHPFYISGTFNRIEPTKAATVSKLIVHPENLTIESKARPEKLAAEMQDPTQSELHEMCEHGIYRSNCAECKDRR